MIENKLRNMQNKEITSSDNKKRFNQFILWRIQYYTQYKWKSIFSIIFVKDFQQFITKKDFDVFDKPTLLPYEIVYERMKFMLKKRSYIL